MEAREEKNVGEVLATISSDGTVLYVAPKSRTVNEIASGKFPSYSLNIYIDFYSTCRLYTTIKEQNSD